MSRFDIYARARNAAGDAFASSIYTADRTRTNSWAEVRFERAQRAGRNGRGQARGAQSRAQRESLDYEPRDTDGPLLDGSFEILQAYIHFFLVACGCRARAADGGAGPSDAEQEPESGGVDDLLLAVCDLYEGARQPGVPGVSHWEAPARSAPKHRMYPVPVAPESALHGKLSTVVARGQRVWVTCHKHSRRGYLVVPEDEEEGA